MAPMIIAPAASFASWLKKRRTSLDLTRKSLAECVGCSPKTIEKIESGERRPSRQIVHLLLSCLDVPSEEHEALLSRARMGHSPEGRETAYSASTDASTRLNNLPAPLTSFVGRTESLETVTTLLRKPVIRLV